MAIDHARDVIRDTIDEVSLKEFEKQCVVVDKLLDVLERTTDPTKAYTMAISWGSSLLSLARIEASLLSAVLPQYEADLEKTSEKIAELGQRKSDAEAMVYELRGSPDNVAPLSVQTSPVRVKERAEARAARDRIFVEVRDEIDALRPEREPLLVTVGKIKRTLRALFHFTETRFPVPLLPARNPMATAAPDPRMDPLAAFAKRYVDRMAGRGSAKERAILAGQERTRIADARPARNWDQLLDEQNLAKEQRTH